MREEAGYSERQDGIRKRNWHEGGNHYEDSDAYE